LNGGGSFRPPLTDLYAATNPSSKTGVFGRITSGYRNRVARLLLC